MFSKIVINKNINNSVVKVMYMTSVKVMYMTSVKVMYMTCVKVMYMTCVKVMYMTSYADKKVFMCILCKRMPPPVANTLECIYDRIIEKSQKNYINSKKYKMFSNRIK